MEATKRRLEIEKRLVDSDIYLSGSELAKEFKVSRQVIVQDIAILRAKGIPILATPQGYIISKINEEGYRKVIASKHDTLEDLEEELKIIVDNGGKILDVIIEHDIYGDIRVDLGISSRKELKNFIAKLSSGNSKPLSAITDGVHFHTIEVNKKDYMTDILKELDEKGYLIAEQ